MVSENIMVTSQLGIHLRPAGAMCNEAVKYQANISFKYGEDKSKSANAKSVVSFFEALQTFPGRSDKNLSAFRFCRL